MRGALLRRQRPRGLVVHLITASAIFSVAMPTMASNSIGIATSAAFDLLNRSGSTLSVLVSLRGSESAGSAMIADEGRTGRIEGVAYYEMGGSHGVEVAAPSTTTYQCDPCTTPLAYKFAEVTRRLRPGRHVVIGVQNLTIRMTIPHGVQVRRYAGYATSRGDTRGVTTSAGESVDLTSVQVASFTFAALPSLSGRSIVFASVPCDGAGIGGATLRGGSNPETLSCGDRADDFFSALRTTKWGLAGRVTGETGLRVRLAALRLT